MPTKTSCRNHIFNLFLIPLFRLVIVGWDSLHYIYFFFKLIALLSFPTRWTLHYNNWPIHPNSRLILSIYGMLIDDHIRLTSVLKIKLPSFSKSRTQQLLWTISYLETDSFSTFYNSQAFHLQLNMISPETHSAVMKVIESCKGS